VQVVAHEAPSERPQAAKFQLLEENLAERLLLSIAKKDLLTSRSGNHMDEARFEKNSRGVSPPRRAEKSSRG
jgi:hypothetical protein